MLGISRRIDQLGRIVIPVEVRKKLKLQEGSLVEISIKGENLILSKNEPLKDFKKYILDICDSVKDCIFFVISEKSIIYASGIYKKYENQEVSDDFLEFCKNIENNITDIRLNNDLNIVQKYAYCYALENYGDLHGFACFFYKDKASLENKGMMNFVRDYINSKL